MGQLRLMRRLVGGMPCVLLAALLLFSRLVAPSLAMEASSVDPAALALQTICHTSAPGDPPGKGDHSDHRDCLLCPACHLVSHAVLPTPVPPLIPLPTVVAIGLSAPLPPSTGPPSRGWTTAQPTGPPDFST